MSYSGGKAWGEGLGVYCLGLGFSLGLEPKAPDEYGCRNRCSHGKSLNPKACCPLGMVLGFRV